MKIYNINGHYEKTVKWIKQQNGSYKINEYPLGGESVGYDKDNLYTFYAPQESYILYSPTGELLKSTTKRPLELGRFRFNRHLSGDDYLTVIQFTDRTFSVIAPNSLEFFSRDISGSFYGVIKTGDEISKHYRVYKYSTCEKVLGSIDLPADNIIVEAPDNPAQPTADVTLIAEYGKPVISPNGDVYTWKRTQDTYSILKWTWKDDPKPLNDSCEEQ